MKNYSRWLSLVGAFISLSIIVFVNYKFIFRSGNLAGKLVLVSLMTAAFSLVCGIICFPRWQGIVAIAVFFFVAYCALFTSNYAVP